MLIRKPVDEVFEAFVGTEAITKVWFTKTTGRLDENERVTWTWEIYGHSVDVEVRSVEANSCILVEWGNYGDKTEIEWRFSTFGDDATFVSVTNRGFKGEAAKLISQIRDSTEGFTILLAGMKAYLEHGIELGLVGDRFPANRIVNEK